MAESNPGALTKEAIKKDRVRFGLGTIFCQSEEVGLGPVPTAIVRILGGDDRHLGMLGSLNVLGSIGHLFGNMFLKWKKSNRQAMIAAMYVGMIVAVCIALALFTGNHPKVRPVILLLYIALSIIFAVVSGMLLNIETSWIGDLVPESLRGWFTKIKWILSICGIIVFTMLIARFADAFPSLNSFAAIYLVFAISFVVAGTMIYPCTTDRTPHVANFISPGKTRHERLNYKSPVLWLFLSFTLLWTPARTITMAFIPVYLMDQFQLSLTKIAFLLTIQSVMSIFVIYVIGDRTDRWGSRRPLLVATGIVGASMSLWFFSAWGGIGCAVAYMIINGASGHTLTMLGTNYQLEIFPAKGRAAYIGFIRLAGLPLIWAASFFSGYLVRALHNEHVLFHGIVLTRYHLIFMATTITALLGMVPLLAIRARRVAPY